MGGSTSQICWRQQWNTRARETLTAALERVGCTARAIPSQQWNPEDSTVGGIRDYKLSSIGSAGDDWSSVLLHVNSLIGESLAASISALQSDPVFVFMEFEQTTWGYVLYQGGGELDRFWSDPESVGEPQDSNNGDPSVVASATGVEQRLIEPYLRHLARQEKAFSDDQFTLNDHWVRVDFMRRAGIAYPNPEDSTWVFIVELGVNEESESLPRITRS